MKYILEMTIDVPEDIRTPAGVEKLVRHYMGAAGCESTNIRAFPLDCRVAAVISRGEAYLEEGQDLQEIIGNCGDALDDANTGEILGTAVFLGTDGRVYIINVEAEIGQIADDYLTQVVKDNYDADEDSAVYVVDSQVGQWPDHGYGYEYVKGEDWSVVLLGGYEHENQMAVVVSTSSVYHEVDAHGIQEGFVWDHPDKADWE